MNLLVDTAKERGVEKRVRVKLFMPERHELKPEEQFNGRPLISHNVGIVCESDSEYLAARGEINYLEGFFCVLTHKQYDYRKMPATAKISVSVQSKPKDGQKSKQEYNYPMMQFEVQLSQEIVLPRVKDIYLSTSKPTADVEVYSNVDFRVEAVDPRSGEALTPHESPLKFSVQKNEQSPRGQNAYTLKLSVTQQTHDRDWLIQIQHPHRKEIQKLTVHFKETAVPADVETEGTQYFAFSSEETPREAPPADGEETGSMDTLILLVLFIVVLAAVYYSMGSSNPGYG